MLYSLRQRYAYYIVQAYKSFTLVLFTVYSNLFKFPVWIPERQKASDLTGSTFGIYSRFIYGLKTNQKPVDSFNSFNDKCSYIEVKPVYIIIIHGKTVLWDSRGKSCSIIKRDMHLLGFWTIKKQFEKQFENMVKKIGVSKYEQIMYTKVYEVLVHMRGIYGHLTYARYPLHGWKRNATRNHLIERKQTC